MKLTLDPVVIHAHKTCGHRCRCLSAKGGCPKCASIRHRKFWALVAKASK